ncbi:Hypothetical predicted protein [Paramuricea clavata]|uniref:Uncharacterized protein n=1 Tax=Paramuricea clavata TaxID=317549 RepID=A0A7D9ECR0_PARCT|nr:Hypothetical predicted protein [Paramuricea clavata]
MPYEIEDERQESEKCDLEDGHIDDNSDLDANIDEPIADEVWLEGYHQRREENNKRMAELDICWNGSMPVTSW